LRDRRICFTFNARKQQILRCAQDDTLEEEFFSSLLGCKLYIVISADIVSIPSQMFWMRMFSL
jgi:hypothetical protein